MSDIQLSNSSVTNNEIGLRVLVDGSIRSYGNNRVFDNDTNGSPTATIGEM